MLLRCMLIAALLVTQPVQAGVTAEKTRIIYNEGTREEVLRLKNYNQYPVITQLWLDDGDHYSRPDNAVSPYIAIPPVFRLNADEIISIRVMLSKRNTPKDRESVHWLNIYELPPFDSKELAEKHKILVTMRTRLKVFYRPKGLSSSSEQAPAAVTFKLENKTLQIENPTPYFITIASAALSDKYKIYPIGLEMLEPFSIKTVKLDDKINASLIEFNWIDDYGIKNTQQTALH